LALIIVGSLVDAGSSYGPNYGFGPGGMMGPYGMMGWRSAPTAPPGTSVVMAGTRFTPPTLTVSVGATVRWFNDDALPHTVSAADRSWDSGNLSPGANFERRFDAAATYAYLCVYHPGMTGTIVT
jgi:plastocyanin